MHVKVAEIRRGKVLISGFISWKVSRYNILREMFAKVLPSSGVKTFDELRNLCDCKYS